MKFKSLKSVITISITMILSIFMILIILYLKNKLESELYKSFENNALNLLKATKNNVNSLYYGIQHYKESITNRRKEELKNYTLIAYSIIEKSYNNYKMGKISEEDAKKNAIDHLRKLRYNNNVGYFWVNDTQRPLPKMIMHPLTPDLEGKILNDEKYNCTKEKKENLFKASVDVCLKNGDGFVEYLWAKPIENKLTKEQPKISYVKLFKPWNWILGTGIYIDDIEAEVAKRLESIKQNLNKVILNQKIGKNGYFFIFNEDNSFIVHPNYLEGRDSKSLDHKMSEKLLNEFKKVAFTKNKSIEYYWDKIGDVGDFKYKKKAFLTYFEPLKWYIASSIYLDDYQRYIYELNKRLVLIGLFFIFMGFIFSIWISKKLTNSILNLINSFNLTDEDGVPFEIDQENSLLEIEILTLEFNKMIKSIKESIVNKKELELQLHQSRKMDAIGQLVGGISHDFNNMLAGIKNAVFLLKSINNNLDDESNELIGIISLASERATALISKLLSFTHKGKLTSTAVDIHSIIDDTISILSKTLDKKISIIVKKEAQNSMIIGDDSQLENAFMNIAINASHVMLNGGELLFETKSINFDDNYCQKSPFDISKGDFIEIKITGLGLSAVYNTIKTHNGEIKVESEIGVGTTFFMYLPCTERKKEIVKEDSLIFSEEKEKLILLVDDEEVIRITGKYILKKLGYSVLTAEDGVEAIEIYKNNKDSIDLIIMDMIMPKMNGAEAFSMLRKINNNCKVIISSGFTRDENLIELKEVGLIGFLAKPFSIDELKSILKKVFSENT